MIENKSQKTCMLYVSDYHFEMIGLLNMKNDKIEGKEIIVLTQQNLEETAKMLISKINLKEDERKEFEKIDWKDNDFDKYKDIQKLIKDNKKISIYIKGDVEYIKKQNEKLNQIIGEKINDITIIDCYKIDDINERKQEIISKYKNKVVTGKIVKI